MNEIKESDWRLERCYISTEDNPAASIKKGDVFVKVSNYVDGKNSLSFNIPSGTALFIESSFECFGEASSLKQKVLTRTSKQGIRDEFLFPY